MAAAFYVEKQLIFDDFKELKKGFSAKADVAKIDPGVNEQVNQYCGTHNGMLTKHETIHITREGFVRIVYDERNVVKRIIKKNVKLIQSISKVDLVAEI